MLQMLPRITRIFKLIVNGSLNCDSQNSDNMEENINNEFFEEGSLTCELQQVIYEHNNKSDEHESIEELLNQKFQTDDELLDYV
ncbi:hypothetical protein JCGZ_22516 [Jatropha curcas]|uniref:Uncharacterized protein n=1 Tax=Jatropha curcas TaxID=180498 RepID=A0A067K1X6_JATCU|nr:hypothetical protein JCGZ_22516 [Jatropha curcas]